MDMLFAWVIYNPMQMQIPGLVSQKAKTGSIVLYDFFTSKESGWGWG